jgi:benzoylsuccinyl-CoA thiolase BbsB subunit
VRDVAVIGVGMTKFGRFPETSFEDLGREAITNAINDADIKPKEIEFGYCGNVYGGMCMGQRVLKEIGIAGIEIINVDNACASGSTALRGVWYAIATGLYDIGIAMGIEKLTHLPPATLVPPGEDLQGEMGMVFPAYFAMIMRKYMETFGTTLEQVAKISVKNHHNGCLNPYSQFQKEVTGEEVLSSRMICDPITLLQCCPTSDGAAAAILCSSSLARRYTSHMITIAASVLRTGNFLYTQEDFTFSDLTANVAKKAYEMANVGPEDIDLCELHDAFAINELLHYEELGFCSRGEGGILIEKGETEIGGKIPVNTSGGLLSKGHPLGATGVAQIAEIVWQLRGKAGKRQVKNPKVGLAHLVGGAVTDIENGACTIHIIKK